MNPTLEALRGGLIVSVQADDRSVLNGPETIATIAACAQANGAVAVRIEGTARIAAVRTRVRIPIVGIIKRRCGDADMPYITATHDDVEHALGAGAQIVAFDATRRARRDGSTTERLVQTIHHAGALAMADCAEAADGDEAIRCGVDIVATTLCGYTQRTAGAALPALDLVKELQKMGTFTIAEGGIRSPDDLAAAFANGADCAVVGTAITNIDRLVERFAAATPRKS